LLLDDFTHIIQVIGPSDKPNFFEAKARDFEICLIVAISFRQVVYLLKQYIRDDFDVASFRMLAHLHQRVCDGCRLADSRHVCCHGLEAADVERRFVGVATEAGFSWVNHRRHLHLFLLAEAEDFAFRGYVHFDFLSFFDSGQRMRPPAERADVSTVTQANVFRVSIHLACEGGLGDAGDT